MIASLDAHLNWCLHMETRIELEAMVKWFMEQDKPPCFAAITSELILYTTDRGKALIESIADVNPQEG